MCCSTNPFNEIVRLCMVFLNHSSPRFHIYHGISFLHETIWCRTHISIQIIMLQTTFLQWTQSSWSAPISWRFRITLPPFVHVLILRHLRYSLIITQNHKIALAAYMEIFHLLQQLFLCFSKHLFFDLLIRFFVWIYVYILDIYFIKSL